MRKHLSPIVLVMALFAGACTSGTTDDAGPTPEPVIVVGPVAVGTTVGDALVAELAAFTTENRVEVTYERYLDNADLVDRVTGPDPPDLVISPQPATLIELAPELVELTGFIDPVALRRDFGDYLIDVVTTEGAVLAAPIKLDLKSLVWYKPALFEAEGFAIPETFADLVSLSDAMVASGSTPWCNYIDAGSATGWMGTDWVEDLLLGAEGPALYDEWVDHSVLFVDPRVETAFERYQQMIDTPGYVLDRASMVDEEFFFNAVPLDAGDCLMHRQATFFAAGLETFDADISEFATFKFPSVDAAFADSQVGGGLYVAAVNQGAEVQLLTQFMLSDRFGRDALAATGAWLLPNLRFDTARYTNELTGSWADLSEEARRTGQFRFDASDLMPAAVGTGSFWTGIVDLGTSAKTVPQVLSDIDASWPD